MHSQTSSISMKTNWSLHKNSCPALRGVGSCASFSFQPVKFNLIKHAQRTTAGVKYYLATCFSFWELKILGPVLLLLNLLNQVIYLFVLFVSLKPYLFLMSSITLIVFSNLNTIRRTDWKHFIYPINLLYLFWERHRIRNASRCL